MALRSAAGHGRRPRPPRPARPRPRSGAGRGARRVRRGRPVGARDPAGRGHRAPSRDQRFERHPSLRGARRHAHLRRHRRVRARARPRARGGSPRPRRECHDQGGAPGEGLRRLESEQRREDDDRAVLAARARRAHRRRAAHLGRARRARPPPPALRRRARPRRGERRPAGGGGTGCLGGTRPLPRQAHRRCDAGTAPRSAGRARRCGLGRRGAVRHPGAPCATAALRPAARTRRGARQLGRTARHTRAGRAEPPGGHDGAASPRVSRLRGHHSRGPVRRGDDDGVGCRGVPRREVA